MEPTVCSRCGKNVAVLFITKIENGETKNEGLCLKCARELHIKPVDDVIARLGLSDDDLDSLTHDMSSLMNGMPEELGADLFGAEDAGEEDEGKTATFPFLSRLMGSQNMGGEIVPSDNHKSENRNDNSRPGGKESRGAKRKFLDTYCINLTDRAREGKLDSILSNLYLF